MDPTARGFSALVPTLITATMDLPLDGSHDGFQGESGAQNSVSFGAGKPVRATVTLARDPVNTPGALSLTLAVSGQGEDGILAVKSIAPSGEKIFNTAAALATALIASKDVADDTQVGGTPGVVLAVLLAAGEALSSLFTDDSQFVLHGAEIESTGHGAPLGGPITLTLDYSVAARVTEIEVPGGMLSVSMMKDQPMRIRVEGARMSLDRGQSGLKMIGLDFDHAKLEVENPGAWKVGGLDSLFDVLRSRSGRGSSWIEVDLGFKLNLGPIKVSGATIRATLGDDGSISASIRGLEAGLTIPGAIDGEGGLQLIDHGFDANLRASVIPLNLGADAGVIYAPPMVVLRLGVDLPAPIPLANSGFGLMGVGGLLGFSAVPNYGTGARPRPGAPSAQVGAQEPRQLHHPPGRVDVRPVRGSGNTARPWVLAVGQGWGADQRPRRRHSWSAERKGAPAPGQAQRPQLPPQRAGQLPGLHRRGWPGVYVRAVGRRGPSAAVARSDPPGWPFPVQPRHLRLVRVPGS